MGHDGHVPASPAHDGGVALTRKASEKPVKFKSILLSLFVAIPALAAGVHAVSAACACGDACACGNACACE